MIELEVAQRAIQRKLSGLVNYSYLKRLSGLRFVSLSKEGNGEYLIVVHDILR